jgi:phosphatidylglycerophosphate synthase
MIKQIPNMITVLRMLCSAALLFVRPISAAFFIIYIICGASDILDGYIARRSGVATSLGATLDSIADIVFFGVMLIVFVSLFQWQWWILGLIGTTVIVRLLSIGIGFAKYHKLACLHTYANKAAGALLFLFPFIYSVFELTITAGLLCSITLLSAIEELVINIISKALNKNVRYIFDAF